MNLAKQRSRVAKSVLQVNIRNLRWQLRLPAAARVKPRLLRHKERTGVQDRDEGLVNSDANGWEVRLDSAGGRQIGRPFYGRTTTATDNINGL